MTNNDASRLLAVVNCRQLVTLSGAARPRTGADMRELAIIENGALLVRDGRIERTGKYDEIKSLITPDYEIEDAGGGVVMPGFVDAHAHPVFAGTRVDEYEQRAGGATYQEIRAAGGGILSTVGRTRAASEDELLIAAKRYANWFLRGGTTTIEAKSGYGLTIEDELKMLRVIRRLNDETALRYVPTFLGAHDVPPEYENHAAAYVALIVDEMLPRVLAENLAEYADAFCEDKVFTVEQTRRVLLAARRHNLKLRLHADQLTLGGGACLAAELRATTADHLEHTDADGIEAMRRAGVQPVLLPASVYALGLSRYPAARRMIDAGLAVVLATDFNPGSSPVPSMPMVLSLASTQMKMTCAEAVTACTVNAAYSLNRGHLLGSLEAGKFADFVIHDCRDYREIAYFVGIESTHTVFVRGQCVFAATTTGGESHDRTLSHAT
ncbi:MAG: imidazolonepropionase [Pyrinomonadaceae bacterium MAG19_C2-C3]|nr:imidazolonepropionase [Pyrinomonadaceae bacterium MAG19_C2-C3]